MTLIYLSSPYPKNDDPTPQMQGHLLTNGSGAEPTTLADLIALSQEYGVDPADIRIAGGHTKWEAMETEEQAVARAARYQAHLDWLEDGARKQYLKLKERFEPEPVVGTTIFGGEVTLDPLPKI